MLARMWFCEFMKTVPLLVMRCWYNSDFPRIIFSNPPNVPMWALPMFVINPCVGFAISQSRAISPRWFAPISTTAISVESSIARTVSGTPIWLFRFPFVAWVLYLQPSTRLTNSLLVVFPFEPVNATTGIFNWSRWCRDSCWRHFSTSGTRIWEWLTAYFSSSMTA